MNTIYAESCGLKNTMISPSCSPPDEMKHAEEKFQKMQIQDLSDFGSMSIADIAETMARDAQNQSPLVDMLGDLLQEQIKKNDPIEQSQNESSPFRGRCCTFTAGYYVKRIAKYSGASPCCLVATLLYLERARQRRPALRLTSRTLQRLLLVASMTATKYLEDVSCLNSRWADIGALTLREINALEVEFLAAVDFNLAVHLDDYSRCSTELRAFHAAQQFLGAVEGSQDEKTARRGRGGEAAGSGATAMTRCCVAEVGVVEAEATADCALLHATGKGMPRFSPAPLGPSSPQF